MTTKTDCFNDLSRSLIRASEWRRVQALRFPADLRNERAATALWRLATAADGLSDDQWEELRPHFDPKGQGWTDTVARCARDVVFRSHPETFADFVQTIADALVIV